MIKIIKILTATGNKNLNNILKKENEFEILENDIFYKEGILEFLEKNKKIDILILYEKLSGEINVINLIKKIKEINNEIIIFFILENKNEELENLLKKENIKNIFLNEEINIDNFIIKLKNAKIKTEEKLNEEIKFLKNIINKKDEEILKLKNKNLINNQKNIKSENEDNNEKNITSESDDYNKNKETEFPKEISIKNDANILKNKPKEKIVMINNGEKIEIIITKINKYSINNKIEKTILKKLNNKLIKN